MSALMRIGTILTVLSVALLIGVVIYGLQDDEVRESFQENREFAREARATLEARPRDLYGTGGYYHETLQLFLMDERLSEGECDTLAGIAETLRDLIAQRRDADPEYAARLERSIASVRNTCAGGGG